MEILYLRFWFIPVGMILIIGLILFGYVRFQKRFISRLSRSVQRAVYPLSLMRLRGKALLLFFSCILIGLACLRPVLLVHLERVDIMKMDIMIVLDISPSMLAQDIKPDRLSRARNEVAGLLNRLPDCRAGLVLFSGASVLQVPLTTDFSSIKAMLSALTPDYISHKGTNFYSALHQAKEALNSSQKDGRKIVLLLTDGEDHSHRLDDLAAELRRDRIPVYAIGIGSSEGSPVPVYDQDGNRVEYLKDRNGHPVVSRLDGAVLEKLTKQTDGKFYRVDDILFDLSGIVSDIAGLEKKKKTWMQRRTGTHELFTYPLFLGVVLLLISVAIPNRSGRIRLMGFMIMSVFLLPSYVSAETPFNWGEWWNNSQGNHFFLKQNYSRALRRYEQNVLKAPQNPITHYNLGNTLQQTGQGEEGLKEWQVTLTETKDKMLRSQVYFNKSVMDIKAENLSEARQNLIQCLINNPGDKAAKQNLEWVLGQMKMKKPPQKQSAPNNERQAPKHDEKQTGNKDSESVSRRTGGKYTQEDAKKILDNFRNNNTLRPQKPAEEESSEETW